MSAAARVAPLQATVNPARPGLRPRPRPRPPTALHAVGQAAVAGRPERVEPAPVVPAGLAVDDVHTAVDEGAGQDPRAPAGSAHRTRRPLRAPVPNACCTRAGPAPPGGVRASPNRHRPGSARLAQREALPDGRARQRAVAGVPPPPAASFVSRPNGAAPRPRPPMTSVTWWLRPPARWLPLLLANPASAAGPSGTHGSPGGANPPIRTDAPGFASLTRSRVEVRQPPCQVPVMPFKRRSCRRTKAPGS